MFAGILWGPVAYDSFCQLIAYKTGINNVYYMRSSASGQDEPNRALWLATRAGKMELSCPLGTTRRVPQEKFPRKPQSKPFFDQACPVKMAGYWPGSSSRSLDTPRKELEQYQPSSPHTCSITHICRLSWEACYFVPYILWSPRYTKRVLSIYSSEVAYFSSLVRIWLTKIAR